MSDDIAFKIQLGVILPKLKEQIAGNLGTIIGELATIVQAGTLGDESVSIDEVKELIMKDIEILLDQEILPDIDKKLNPPAVEEPTPEDQGESTESE